MNTVDVLKALADETRLRMVNLLLDAGDLCACEVENVLGLNQSNASRHLSRLKAARIVATDKRGLWVHFSLSKRPDVGRLIGAALEMAVGDVPSLGRDLVRLGDYRASGHTCKTIGEWTASEAQTTHNARVTVPVIPH